MVERHCVTVSPRPPRAELVVCTRQVASNCSMSSIDQSNGTPSQKAADSLSSSAVSPPAAPTYTPPAYNHEVASHCGPRIGKTSFVEAPPLAVISHRSSKAVSNDYARGPVDSQRTTP